MSFFEEKKSYIITSVIGLVIVIAVCLLDRIYAAEDMKQVYRILSDAFFIPGVLLIGIGMMVVAANEGLFNGIAYGLKTVGRSLSTRKGEKIKEEEFHEYNERMKKKKHSVAHLIIVGVVLFVISLLFLVLYML